MNDRGGRVYGDAHALSLSSASLIEAAIASRAAPTSLASTARGERPGAFTAAERGHEVRAALFAIEASAAELRDHCHRLTSTRFEQLADGLVEEIRRVRVLLDGRTCTWGTFDLEGAFGPVMIGAAALGLDVRSSLPDGVEVEGRRDSAAQVLLVLLDNVAKHAGSPTVDVHAAVFDDEVVASVEDRGTGIPGRLRRRLFEAGVAGDASAGSGLGLHIARRLMGEQGGSISVRARRGGGASFELRFRRPAS